MHGRFLAVEESGLRQQEHPRTAGADESAGLMYGSKPLRDPNPVASPPSARVSDDRRNDHHVGLVRLFDDTMRDDRNAARRHDRPVALGDELHEVRGIGRNCAVERAQLADRAQNVIDAKERRRQGVGRGEYADSKTRGWKHDSHRVARMDRFA